MKIFKIIFLLLILIQINNCTNFNEAMSGKSKTTDEFLVKKKKPLILPPDLDQIPEPGTKVEKKSEEKDVLKEILKQNTKVKKSSEKSSSIEESIIRRLPK